MQAMKTNQTGSSLILVLITLAVMLFGAVAMIKSSETTTQAVGNTAFRQAAVASADVAINDAATYLANRVSVDLDDPNRYYATVQASDASGLPTTVDWTKVTQSQTGNYSLQYIVDRLCSGTLPVSDVLTQCNYDSQAQSSSNKAGASVYAASAGVYYRATVRITGPKNTEVFVQATLVK